MDCERFEAGLIDELYGELDELTSAAAKRHAAGCARCASLLGGLRATRRVAALPIVEPSQDLEDRILAAARDAGKVVPAGHKVARAISWAGSWAMRPQTAMAAVFVLMVGSSVLFVRRRKVADNATVTVTAHGAPAAAAAAPALPDESASLDSKVAAAAHGAGPAVAYAPPAASAAPSEGLGGLGGGAYGKRGGAADEVDLAQERARKTTPIAPAFVRGAPPGSGIGNPSPPGEEAQSAQTQPADSRAPTPLDRAKALYLARDYAGATSAYDALAAGGDLDAALGAARSVRDGDGGCAVAKDRFDQITTRAWGTTAGYEATLEGGKCYRALGALDAAQSRYAKLLTVQQFAPLAQAEINAMSQMAARAISRKTPASKPAGATSAVANPSTRPTPFEAAPSQPRLPPTPKGSAQ